MRKRWLIRILVLLALTAIALAGALSTPVARAPARRIAITIVYYPTPAATPTVDWFRCGP